MRAPIAQIRINAGNPGWYDPLTNIHLTITRPLAVVYEGSNTSNIKQAVKFGLVHVIDGSLDTEVSTIESKPAIKEEVREVTSQEEVKIDVVEEVKEKATDDVIPCADIQEEVVEEKPKAKKTSTKKKTTKKEEK